MHYIYSSTSKGNAMTLVNTRYVPLKSLIVQGLDSPTKLSSTGQSLELCDEPVASIVLEIADI